MTCLFVEHLTVIDCAFLDEQRGLVGESWIVDVELDGALDEQSMVLDFGEVKKRLKRAIDASVDHTLLVPMRSPALSIEEDAAAVALDFRSARGRISHRSPPQALTRLDAETVDAAALSAQLTPILKAVVPASVGALRLALRNELIDGAFHHYTHGLKKHDGHCQRIAHGHRSRIDIRVDGRRDTELEAALARDWRDIYLATREDLRHDDGERLHFDYTSREGAFALALPRAHCDLLETDTTIECIAEHLATTLAPLRAGCRLEARAYEGVMKGARATAIA
jgi:6-pyruvoyl-tetrahydropterin synthase